MHHHTLTTLGRRFATATKEWASAHEVFLEQPLIATGLPTIDTFTTKVPAHYDV